MKKERREVGKKEREIKKRRKEGRKEGGREGREGSIKVGLYSMLLL